ncbi:hypothetical protein CIB48_g12333, partial [Xylaria polymorpha]
PNHPSHLNNSLALYPGVAASSAGYSNAHYAAPTQPAPAPSAHHQAVTYTSYPAGSVTTQHPGYGSGGYQSSASTAGYGPTSYSPQHQANPYVNQYTHAQPSPQLSPLVGHYGVQSGGYGQTHTHNPQAAARMTYSPVSASQTAASYSQPPSQRNSATLATLQTQHGLPSYGDSYASHTPTHSGQYQTASPSYQDPSVAAHYPAPLPTPQSHDVSRHMSEDLAENDDEDAQGEPADESAEIYANPDLSRPPVSSIPTPSNDQPKSGAACGNPFEDLSAFFGPIGMFPKPCGASPCFATWLRRQPNVDELDVDLMVDMLLSDDESWAKIREYTEAFQQWEDRWKKARVNKGKKNKEERERLEYELLRGGLGSTKPEGDFNGFRYSFCQSHWVPAGLWDHCPECEVCRSSVEWHCHKHGRCTENRICPDCASTTLPYHHQQQQQQRQMYST